MYKDKLDQFSWLNKEYFYWLKEQLKKDLCFNLNNKKDFATLPSLFPTLWISNIFVGSMRGIMYTPWNFKSRCYQVRYYNRSRLVFGNNPISVYKLLRQLCMVNNNVVQTMTLLETVKVRQTATTSTYTERFFLKTTWC